MEIIRDFHEELIDAEQQRQERIILRAILVGVITKESGELLFQEVWHGGK